MTSGLSRSVLVPDQVESNAAYNSTKELHIEIQDRFANDD